jgi:hypothetical protein
MEVTFIAGTLVARVMPDSVGSQLHVGFGALGNHDTSVRDGCLAIVQSGVPWLGHADAQFCMPPSDG